MESSVPWRLACQILRLRKSILALFVPLAAMLFLATAALAALPNQDAIDNALKELTTAEAAARADLPGNSRIKEAEDALDAAKRANEDTSSDVPAAKTNAEAAEAAAQATADALLEELKDRSRDILDGRAARYREALDKRRAARKKLQALLAELRTFLTNRRNNLGGTKEVEDAINLLRPRLSQSEMPIALQSTALSPLGSMMANVASDSQTNCTYGSGVSMPVAFVPSNQNGDALPAIGKALASLPLMAPGGATTPSNSGGPETAPKADKPQSTAPPSGGPRTATPQGGNTPAPQGSPPSGSTPSGPGSATSRSDAQPDENRELAKAAEALFRLMQKRPPEPPSIQSGTTPPEEDSILDEIQEVINMGAGSELTYDERMAREFADWLEARSKNVLTRDPSGLTPMERFVVYHQYLKELREARQSLGGSADNSAVFDEAIRKLKAQRESRPPPSRTVPPAGSNISRVKITSNAEFGSTSPGASLEQVPAREPGPQLSPEMLKPAWERPNAWPTPPDAGNEAGKTVGDKSAPGEKPASGVQSSLQSQKIEKSTPKAEPGDKTPASGAAAYPEKAEGTVTIILKVVESVLQGGSQGPEIREHTTKFATKVTAPEPAVPKTGQTKSEKATLDKGHDRSPVTCTTGADGRCKAQVPADELESYGLPALTAATDLLDKTAARAVDDPLLEFFKAHGANGASRNYSVELARAGTAGVVIQKNSAKPASALLVALKDLPPGVQVQRSDFRIGNKTYTRVAFTGPAAITTAAAKKFADSLGNDAQIDQCDEKAPGPPLGMTPVSFSALNSELPQATVALRQSADLGGIKR